MRCEELYSQLMDNFHSIKCIWFQLNEVTWTRMCEVYLDDNLNYSIEESKQGTKNESWHREEDTQTEPSVEGKLFVAMDILVSESIF